MAGPRGRTAPLAPQSPARSRQLRVGSTDVGLVERELQHFHGRRRGDLQCVLAFPALFSKSFNGKRQLFPGERSRRLQTRRRVRINRSAPPIHFSRRGDLGFGRIVSSEREALNLSTNPASSGGAAVQRANATEPSSSSTGASLSLSANPNLTALKDTHDYTCH
jgi:hypothetical protein